MRLVILESPYAASETCSVEDHIKYALECVADCLLKGEAPIASHLLFPQLLDDTVPDQRALGIKAGLAWANKADAMVVYLDKGISSGMAAAVRFAISRNIPIEYRFLDSQKIVEMPTAKPVLRLVEDNDAAG